MRENLNALLLFIGCHREEMVALHAGLGKLHHRFTGKDGVGRAPLGHKILITPKVDIVELRRINSSRSPSTLPNFCSENPFLTEDSSKSG